MSLNPETILAHATSILSEYGLADLTMRRLARSLDVAPGALYWHYPNKQALLGAIANHLLRDLRPPVYPHGPSELDAAEKTGNLQREQLPNLVEYCVGFYRALTSMRDGAEITLAALASKTVEIDAHAELEKMAGSLGSICFHYILGAAMDLQARQNVASALGNEEDMPAPQPQKIGTEVQLILAPVHFSSLPDTGLG